MLSTMLTGRVEGHHLDRCRSGPPAARRCRHQGPRRGWRRTRPSGRRRGRRRPASCEAALLASLSLNWVSRTVDVREFLGHRGLEAFFALVGGGNARLHVRHEDLARAANRRGQRACGDLAAQHVVGRDVGQREIGVARAGLVVAGADERIDGDDRNAGVMRLAAAARSAGSCRSARSGSRSGARAITASSTGTCVTGLKSGAPWNTSSTPRASAAACAPRFIVM